VPVRMVSVHRVGAMRFLGLCLAALMSLVVPPAHAQMVSHQTGTTYTFQPADCDGAGVKAITFSNSAGVAVTLPQAGANNHFLGGCTIQATNLGAGTVTITPATSTINGVSSLSLTTGQSARIVNDAAGAATGNYYALLGAASGSGASIPTAQVLGGASGSYVPLNLGTNLSITGGVLNATGGGGAVSSVSNSDSTLTISPTTGAVVASLNLAHANTWTGAQTIQGPDNSGTTMLLVRNLAGAFVLDVPDNGNVTMSNALALGTASSVSGALTMYMSSNTGSVKIFAQGGTVNANLMLPDVTDQVAVLGTPQTFAATQTFNNLTVTGTCTGCGSGSITWPTTGDIVLSNSTSSPAGLAPVNGDCVVGSGGAWTAGSCSSATTTITLGAGLTSTPGTQNTGTQTVTNGSTISQQTIPKFVTTNYTIDTSAGCPDTGAVITMNGASSLTITMPTPGLSCALNGTAYSFSDKSGHGYTLAPAGGSATISGLGTAATSFAVPAYGSVYCTSDGTSTYQCSGGSLAIAGTVTSVGLTVPSFLTVTGSPVTGSGTLAVTATSESANTFLAAPNGSSGAMTPRTIVTADLTGQVGMEVDFFYSGVPGNSAVLAKAFSRATTVAASAPIKCNAIVGATSSATVTLTKVTGGSSSSIGTLVFAASGSAFQGCTVTFSSSVSFAAGDMIRATFPGTADATLANVAISIPAVQ
jgi:hypothetical protein